MLLMKIYMYMYMYVLNNDNADRTIVLAVFTLIVMFSVDLLTSQSKLYTFFSKL